jgi:50S ribosomal protein L4
MIKTSRLKEKQKPKSPFYSNTLDAICDESNFLTDKPAIACQSVDFKT